MPIKGRARLSSGLQHNQLDFTHSVCTPKPFTEHFSILYLLVTSEKYRPVESKWHGSILRLLLHRCALYQGRAICYHSASTDSDRDSQTPVSSRQDYIQQMAKQQDHQ
jgi:hypothetical protein